MNLSIVINYISKMLICKKSYILISFLFSFLITTGINKIYNIFYNYIELENGIISFIILFALNILAQIFIIFDFITGIIASKKRGDKIKSSKWGITVGKFFGLFLYFFLSFIILLLLSNNNFVLIMIFSPIILTILKEYISVGENFESMYGKKAYMFTIIDKIFDILENKLFKMIKNKKIIGENKPEENESEENNTTD